MKILRVMGYPMENMGSLERFVLREAEELHKQSHELHLLFDGPKNPELSSFIEKLEAVAVLYWFPSPQAQRSLYIRQMTKLIRHFNFDIVHVDFDPAARITAWIAYFLRVPCILRTIGSYPLNSESDPLFIRFLKQLKWRMEHLPMDRLICVSQGIRDYVAREYRYPLDKTDVVYATIDTQFYHSQDEFDNKFIQKEQSITITYLGRLEPIKGIENLISALKPLKSRYPQLKTKIIGDGSLMEKLKEDVSTAGLEDVVEMPGRIHDLLDILTNSDIYVHPSYMEGCPGSILEAMAYGVPVVASDVGGIKEQIRNGVDGILVPSGEPSALERGIVKLIEDKDFYQTVRESARKRVVELFDNAVGVHDLLNIYISESPK